MATYANLTQGQKDALALGDAWLRGALVSLIGFTKQADFDLKLQYWTDNIDAALAALDAGQVIPQSTNHAGASGLTKAEYQAIKNWLASINSDMTSNLSVAVKAVGVNV